MRDETERPPRARRDTIPLPIRTSSGGRPRDDAARAAVLAARERHPELRTHDQIAAFVSRELGRPVSRNIVRDVLPPLKPPAGGRVQVSAEQLARLRGYLGKPKATAQEAVAALLDTLPPIADPGAAIFPSPAKGR